ncbi:MAG TPA: hypothetical protein VMT63_02550 [Bacteroidales bacterium]|nr:hypothetical protein [Bacteroidales bacterium]
MEAETTVESGRKRIWIWILPGLFLAFTAYYATMCVISSSRRVREINSLYGYKPGEKNNIDIRLFTDSAFIKLNREKAYYQSRNLLAERDSIYLSLNLPDSAAYLEINGVTVHTSRLEKFSLCKAMTGADEYAVSSMLSMPLTIKASRSTIQKEPVMLKIAPKDTSEYKPDILPDTTNSAPVNYYLEMDNGFRIYVYESESSGMIDRLKFDIDDRLKNSWTILKSIATFKVPEYHPSIRLRMKKADARIIYRALPVHGQIALFW